MMKRFVYMAMLLLLSVPVVAQKKQISQAKTNIKNGTNLENTEKSMRQLLADSANSRNEKVWLLLFNSVRKQYEQGNEKLYLKQNYDTAQLFLLAKKMFDVLEEFDSIESIPDANGHVKVHYRSKHAAFLDRYRQNIYSGGSFFIRKQRYQDAYNMYDTYIRCASHPLFSQYNYAETDKWLPEASYWSVFCGYKLKNPQLAMEYSGMAKLDSAHHVYLLQYMSELYLQKGDTASYVSTLTEGFEQYPSYSFFCPRLVDYYCLQHRFDNALEVVNKALRTEPANWLYRFAKSTILMNTGEYDDCISLCDELIGENDTIPDVFYNAGLSYYRKAIEKEQEVRSDRKRKSEVLELYRRSLPYLERYRALAPDQSKRWLMPLYTIYLNLNMGEEFEEMERLLIQSEASK